MRWGSRRVTEPARLGLRSAWGLLICQFVGLLLLLGSVSLHRQKDRANSLGEDGTTPSGFVQAKFHQIKIFLPPNSLKTLRERPRKYVHADIEWNGCHFKNVGIHLKGSESFQPLDEKPSLTLSFDRFGPVDGFRGPAKVHLNNSAEDPTFLQEMIGSDLFRAAGIAAPDVAHASVELNGKGLGLYVLKEGITRDFLTRSFQSTAGVVYEPDSAAGVLVAKNIDAEDWPKGPRRLDAVQDSWKQKDLAARVALLTSSLDIDRFITFIAMELLIVHRDGYCLAANNFRIYENFDTQRLNFIPAGMDQIFGKADYPLSVGLSGEFARTVVAADFGPEKLKVKLCSLLPLLTPDPLNRRIDAQLDRLKGHVTRREFNDIQSAADDLKERILQRYEFLQEHLKAESGDPRLLAQLNAGERK